MVENGEKKTEVNDKINEEVLNKKISDLKAENAVLGRKLAVLYNIVEISTYINSFISQDNIIQLINDMVIGILGVQYSTIYLKEEGELKVKATNIRGGVNSLDETIINYMNEGKEFIINSKENISEDKDDEIYSKMGIPIKIGEKVIGYIVGEHSHSEYFNDEHKIFIGAVANQVAIALDNSNLYRKLEEVAKMDSLMKIYNRRTFFELAEKYISQNDIDFAIVMVDLDNFKRVNDTLGHQMGDKVLVETTKVIKRHIKDGDIIGRYGGEEIIVFIRDIDTKENIFKRVDKIREDIESNNIDNGDSHISITASFGLSFRGADIRLLEDIIEEADKSLYKAKKSGRNRVVAYSQE